MEVLRTKHPNAHPPSTACLDAYPNNPPEMVPVDITDDVVRRWQGPFWQERGQGGLTQSVFNTGSSGSGRQAAS